MTFSPLIFLALYAVLLVIFLFLAIANFYNVIRFSFLKGPVIVATIVFVVLMVGIVLGTLRLAHYTDWREPITLTLPFTTSSDTNEGS